MTGTVVPQIMEWLFGESGIISRNPNFEEIKYTYQLIDNYDTNKATIIAFFMFISFGPSTLIYSNAMGNISVDIIEAAKIDGITLFKEMWHITLPQIWPTISTFLVIGIAGIFTNMLGLYDLYGTNAPPHLHTVGYYLFSRASGATAVADRYPYLSCLGIVFTLFVVPVTMIVRKLLEKFGPSEN